MRLFGLIAIMVGCLMGAPALAMLAGGKAVYAAVEDAFGPFFPFVAGILGDVANEARIAGAKMLATALVMIIGGLYLRRPTREQENDRP